MQFLLRRSYGFSDRCLKRRQMTLRPCYFHILPEHHRHTTTSSSSSPAFINAKQTYLPPPPPRPQPQRRSRPGSSRRPPSPHPPVSLHPPPLTSADRETARRLMHACGFKATFPPSPHLFMGRAAETRQPTAASHQWRFVSEQLTRVNDVVAQARDGSIQCFDFSLLLPVRFSSVARAVSPHGVGECISLTLSGARCMRAREKNAHFMRSSRCRSSICCCIIWFCTCNSSSTLALQS